MNVFATAIDCILVDANLEMAALWLAGGTGPGIAVRVIRKSPDKITRFGAGRIPSETTLLEARIADMATPAPGDLIRVGAKDVLLPGGPKLDRERLIWTLNMRTA